MNFKTFYRHGPLAVLFLAMLTLAGPAFAQTPTAADADFNGNGEVDIPDFLEFVNAYGTQRGQANYDVKFDLDGDGEVGISDFLAFVNLYGQTVQDTESVAGDRAALVALYNATNGSGWGDNTNWLSDEPLGEWFGVSTDAEGRVESLTLRSNNLSGSIPVELGNLTNLEYLSLENNKLSGSIPVELGDLTNLALLYLYRNKLSGSIPVALGNLTNLTYLSLGDNQLSGTLPVELGNLTNLTLLYLGSNQLSGSIPVALGNLTNLEYLRLENNKLSGSIPVELGDLTNLKELYLSGNSGLCLPASLQSWGQALSGDAGDLGTCP